MKDTNMLSRFTIDAALLDHCLDFSFKWPYIPNVQGFLLSFYVRRTFSLKKPFLQHLKLEKFTELYYAPRRAKSYEIARRILSSRAPILNVPHRGLINSKIGFDM